MSYLLLYHLSHISIVGLISQYCNSFLYPHGILYGDNLSIADSEVCYPAGIQTILSSLGGGRREIKLTFFDIEL